MNILVTGSEGFIGSHLVELLIRENHNISAFVHYNSFNNWGWLEHLDEKNKKSIRIIQGDVRNIDSVSDAIGNIDVIIHLAALIAIPYSYQTPESYIDTNVKGTLNILSAAKTYGIKRVLITSTSEVYGTAKYTPIDEEHPLQGQSPYSASKIGADMLAESFYRSFGVPITIVRPFNTYGPRQSNRAIIPTIITQLLSGKEEIRLGSLSPTRDFNYVKDTVKGFWHILNSPKTIGEVVNISSEKEISIGDLAQKTIDLINPKAKIILDDQRLRPQKSEVNQLLGSNKKLKRLTSWKQTFTLDEGLLETIEFFKNYGHLYKADLYNV